MTFRGGKKILIALCFLMSLYIEAAEEFSALEQQQISIETPGLFDRSNMFTVDFVMLHPSDYCFPLPVGKARLLKDYNVEISTSKGDAVKAMFSGTVRLSRRHPQFGNIIVIRHDNGFETVYGDNAQNLVKVGERVDAGQTIAIVGGNGNNHYCTFAIMMNGGRVNPEMLISLKTHRLFRQVIMCKKGTSWNVEFSVVKEDLNKNQENMVKPFANGSTFVLNLATIGHGEWCYPLPDAHVISAYGSRGGKRHTGVDIKTRANDAIYAAFDGVVTYSANYYGYGNLIRIQHNNGLETYYSHNSKNMVKAGDVVKAGQKIALTGRTGRATTEHLHFETRINGKPFDPQRVFDHNSHSLRTDELTFAKSGRITARKQKK